MKRSLVNILIATSCVLALVGGSGCRTVKKKTAAVEAPAPAPTQPAIQPPSMVPAKAERKGWFTKKRVATPQTTAAVETPAAAVPAPLPPITDAATDRASERKGWIAKMFSRKTPPPALAASPEKKTVAATNQPPAVVENPNKAVLIYHIQINDQAIISLIGIPQEQRFDVIVDEHGYIKLPYIENIHAEGKTSSELETLIRDSYIKQQIYKRITVNVALPNQLQTYYYYVRGELRGAGGRMPWVSGMTIMQAVAAAGGPSDFASSKIQVTRGGKTFSLNINDVAKHPEKDQPLLPGDVIVLPRSWM